MIPPSTTDGLGRPIPSLFRPYTAGPKETAASRRLPFTVLTAPEQWAYAAAFDRSGASVAVAGGVIVRVVLEVTAGAVGVGCLNKDQIDFIDEEVVQSGGAPDIVDLVAEDADSIGTLIVRNASARGVSAARILEIHCFAFDRPPNALRAPSIAEPAAISGWERYYGTRGATPLEKLRVQTFNTLKSPAVLQWVDGMAVRIIPGDQLSRALFVSGTYEPNTLCVLRRLLSEGDVFFDVGANAGIVTLAASRWVGAAGRIYSFEPSEREYARLVDNLSLSGASCVTPVRGAVSDRAGRRALRIASSTYGGLNTLGERFAYDGVETDGIEMVDALTLDDFVTREGITRVAAIKLDVEGAEGAALAGGSRILREHRPALVMEVFARALEANHWTVDALERLLLDARYRVYSIDDGTAALSPIARLSDLGERNVVAMPEERC